MSITAARLELERAYKLRMDAQETADLDRQLWAAGRVIAAWEAVSHEVTVMCVDGIDAIQAKGLQFSQ